MEEAQRRRWNERNKSWNEVTKVTNGMEEQEWKEKNRETKEVKQIDEGIQELERQEWKSCNTLQK